MTVNTPRTTLPSAGEGMTWPGQTLNRVMFPLASLAPSQASHWVSLEPSSDVGAL